MYAVSSEMIDAAGAFYRNRLPNWQLAERTVDRLHGLYPRFDQGSCQIKAIVLNELYSTSIIAVKEMAQHVFVILNDPSQHRDNTLVERIARFPVSGDSHISFASKFCHFFINKDRFHILDDAAEWTLNWLQVPGYKRSGEDRYANFCRGIEALGSALPSNHSTRDIDRFLWLVGMWVRHKRERTEVNAEAVAAFERAPEEVKKFVPPELLNVKKRQRKKT